jgi:hypothetical protein
MASELNPTSIPVYGARAIPSEASSPYAESAAFTWPGMSISGTTSTNRSAAYATMRR